MSAELAASAMERLRYPSALTARVRRIVRWHMLDAGKADALRARRLLAKFGEELAFDLVDHRIADLLGKRGPDVELPAAEIERFETLRRVLEQERTSPYRISDLAIDGNDLIELGYQPGPQLGRTLEELRRQVVGDPTLNTPEWLTKRARELL